MRLRSLPRSAEIGHLALRALDLRQPVERLAEARAQQIHVGARLREQRADGAAFLVDQGEQHVERLEELVVAADGQRLGVGERRLELAGEFVHAHEGLRRCGCTAQNGAPGR